jgi:hypothetical protein
VETASRPDRRLGKGLVALHKHFPHGGIISCFGSEKKEDMWEHIIKGAADKK